MEYWYSVPYCWWQHFYLSFWIKPFFCFTSLVEKIRISFFNVLKFPGRWAAKYFLMSMVLSLFPPEVQNDWVYWLSKKRLQLPSCKPQLWWQSRTREMARSCGRSSGCGFLCQHRSPGVLNFCLEFSSWWLFKKKKQASAFVYDNWLLTSIEPSVDFVCGGKT